MADRESENIKELKKIVDEITNKFQQDLSVVKLSDLDILISSINSKLEQQNSLIEKISNAEIKQLNTTIKNKNVNKETTKRLNENLNIYGDLLSFSNDFNFTWDSILNKTKSVRAENDLIVKLNKQALIETNKLFDKEKKIQKNRLDTFKKVNNLRKKINVKTKTNKTNNNNNFLIPQFANPQSILSAQITLEKLSGGKPYLASHPEMGVPIGLFNTKDEPNRIARIKAIKKYGPSGSLNDVLPQYSDYNYPTTSRKIEGNNQSIAAFIALKGAAKTLGGKGLDVLVNLVDTINQFGDKLEEYAGEADEAIRSSLQIAGILQKRDWGEMFTDDGTPIMKASYFQKNVEELNRELANEGIFFNIEAITKLQKQFTEISKTNVLLGKKDLRTLAHIQTTFNLADNDVAEMQSAFMELGFGAKDISDYTDQLTENSLKFGINAGKLIKDSGKYLRLASIYRFKGGVKDMQKMQVYAANSRFDIENAYNVMDKALSIEGAIDLASQLQVLGGSFANLTGADLFGMAMGGDSEAFIKTLVEAFRQDVGRFGKYEKGRGFEFSTAGIQLLRAFKNIDGFDLGEDIENIIVKFGKEDAIRQKILNGRFETAQQFQSLSLEKQNQIVAQIAQGSVEELNLTGLDYANDLIDLQAQFFSESEAFNGINSATAAATVSVEDQVNLNKQLVKLESQTAEAFDTINLQLRNLAPLLKIAGETIYNVGIESFKNEFFRQVEVMTDYMGLSTDEALLMRLLFGAGIFDGDELASGVKGIINGIEGMLVFIDKFAENNIAQSQKNIQEGSDALRDLGRSQINEGGFGNVVKGVFNSILSGMAQSRAYGPTHERGGLLSASGGMVMGPSHSNGGVRGSGMFNNVEVEGGEAIINKKSTKMFLPLLSKLNKIGGGKAFGPDFNISNGENKIINLKINGRIIHKGLNDKNKINPRIIAQMVASEESGEAFEGAY